MRRIVFISVALALGVLLVGAAHAQLGQPIMKWYYDAKPVYNDPQICICRGEYGGVTCIQGFFDYDVRVTILNMDVTLTVTPGPNNRRDSGSYTIPPGPGSHTVCLDDIARLTSDFGGQFTVAGGSWYDTPSIEVVDELGTYCGDSAQTAHRTV